MGLLEKGPFEINKRSTCFEARPSFTCLLLSEEIGVGGLLGVRTPLKVEGVVKHAAAAAEEGQHTMKK